MSANSEDGLLKESIKNNIRKYREQNGMTQTQVGEILGTGRTTYTKWESGATLPNPIQLIKLCLIYNIELSELIKFNNPYRVAADDAHDVYGNNLLSELNDEEREIIAKYRLLNREGKDKIERYINDIKSDDT